MSAQNEDFLFAQEAQDKGYVTEAQLEEGFLLQRRMADDLKIDERIAVILVKRGWLAEEQARRIYALIEPEGQRTRIEGYRIVERIGRGAMGTVYKAIHLGLHRVVAIKVLRQELLDEKVHSQRLSAEAKMLASLDHPNIVAALDAGESNGFPYVVMEYVEGETIKELLARDGPLDEDEALRITRAIADALERARRMGVVHRDVKPGNILLSTKGEPKLMDLGLARGPIDLELTQQGATVGTPQFMSPEQVEDAGKVDTRSDIYSLGATLYAMLTGRPPFTAATMTEILTKVLNEEPVPVRVRNREVSPEVGYLLQRMMLKDASLRYQTPAQVVEDIDNITGGQSIVPAGFTGNWEAWLLRQRIRKLTRVGVFVGVLAIVVGTGLFILNRYLDRAKAREYQVTRTAELEQTEPDIRDTLADAKEKLRLVRDIHDDIQQHFDDADVSDGMPDVDRQVVALTRYVGRYEAFEQLESKALALADERRYKTAFRLVQNSAPDHNFQAIHGRWRDLLSGIRERSNEDWHAERRRAHATSPGDLDALVALFTSYRGVLQGDYVVEGPQAEIEHERISVKARADEAAAVEEAVRRFEHRFDEKAVVSRIRQNTTAALKRDVDRKALELETVADSTWGGIGWNPAIVRKPLAAHVAGRIDAVKRRVDDAVLAHWRDVQRSSEDFVGQGRIAEASALVSAFRHGLGTAYEALRGAAKRHLAGLDVELAARKTLARRIQYDAIVNTLARLRDGHVDGARDQIARAGERAPTAEDHERLKQLLYVVQAYDSASDLALRYLEANADRMKATTVELLDQTVERWRPTSVDRSAGVVLAVAADHRRTKRPYAIADFHVSQIRAWAEASGGDLSERDRLLLRLLEMPGEPYEQVLDLRSALPRFRALADDFAGLPGIPTIWNGYVTDSAAAADAIQNGVREVEASTLIDLARRYLLKGLYTMARKVYEELLDDTKPWYYTRAAESSRDDARKKLAVSIVEEKRADIERWIPGAQAEELAGQEGRATRTRIGIDFDVPLVLAQFDHGFARLVDQRGARAVTPGVVKDDRYQLELLPDVDALLPGRPLSFPSPFDPGAPIEVAFDLRTRKGAFFLAIDIDGVQLGVLSADPGWYSAWQVPERLRLDEKDPLVQYYGRGRGIAVHAGTGFGDVAVFGEGWSWGRSQFGARFAEWEGREEMTGNLFAFVPGRSYRVRLRRERDTLVLEVADLDRYEKLSREDREKIFREVFRRQEDSWRQRGSADGWRSEIDPAMRMGTGRIQILTWTTVIIDDLELTGVVRQAWRDQKEEAEKKEDR